jgi:MSHA biogenesis protein MshJ
MNRWWSGQAARINALSFRERLFLFLSLLSICLAVTDRVWLTPAQSAYDQSVQKLAKQNLEVTRSREALKAMGNLVKSAPSLDAEMSALKTRLDQVNQAIKVASLGADDDKSLSQILVHLLRKHEGLTLVKTASLPAGEAGKAASSNAPAADQPANLTRQGVELTVAGNFAQLMQYVQTLETALPNVHWGLMKLKSDKQPPELMLQLFLVGVSP